MTPLNWLNEFQSTLPMRGATASGYIAQDGDAFQSTLPMRGATSRHSRMVRS